MGWGCIMLCDSLKHFSYSEISFLPGGFCPVPNGAGTVYPSRAPEFILGFSDLLVA
jgi:hypothetical protein